MSALVTRAGPYRETLLLLLLFGSFCCCFYGVCVSVASAAVLFNSIGDAAAAVVLNIVGAAAAAAAVFKSVGAAAGVDFNSIGAAAAVVFNSVGAAAAAVVFNSVGAAAPVVVSLFQVSNPGWWYEMHAWSLDPLLAVCLIGLTYQPSLLWLPHLTSCLLLSLVMICLSDSRRNEIDHGRLSQEIYNSRTGSALLRYGSSDLIHISL